VHPAKHEDSIVFTLAGITIDFRDEFWKHDCGNAVSSHGLENNIDVNDGQSPKQFAPSWLTFGGREIAITPLDFSAEFPSSRNEDGISNFTEWRKWHPEKHESEITRTCVGTTIERSRESANADTSNVRMDDGCLNVTAPTVCDLLRKFGPTVITR
jgi:hypothetical protein